MPNINESYLATIDANEAAVAGLNVELSRQMKMCWSEL